MKTKTSISTLLGLTQAEAAQLLNVGVSHFSMYESGKRNLPLEATQLLAELLSKIDRQPVSKPHLKMAPDEGLIKKHIEKSLNEIEYQRLLTKRKCDGIERKIEKEHKRAQLTGVIDTLNRTSKLNKQLFVPRLKTKSVASTTALTSTLAELALKLELLELQKRFLEFKLNGKQL